MSGGDEVERRIAEVLRAVLNMSEPPAADVDLIDDGLLDSLGLISLITDIEQEFGFELPLDDFDIEAFRTPAAIASFVGAALPSTEEAGR